MLIRARLPRISVVIPVHDDPAGIARCLGALDRQSYPIDRLEVLVVDNGSRPPIELPPTASITPRLLREEAPGSYAARNRGVVESTGELLAFTDADCEPNSDWLERGAAAVGASPGIGLVAGRIELTFGDPAHRSAAELFELVTAFRQEHYARDLRFAATANAFTPRAVFDRVGGFHATVQSGGDVEFGRRIGWADLRIEYAADAVVRHPARRTLTELRLRRLRVVAGEWRREPSRLRSLSLIVRLLLPPVRPLVGIVREGRAPKSAGDLARFAAVLTWLRWVESGERLRLAVGLPARGWRSRERSSGTR